MELKQFVTESIVQIAEGIEEAQERLKEKWVRINPKPPVNVNAISPMLYCAENGAGVFPLTFDVAVSAEDVQANGSLGIKVLNIGMEVRDNSQQVSSRVSRVSFTVPIAYPLKKVKKG